LRELRGEPKEEVNIDGEAEENGYLGENEQVNDFIINIC